MRAHTAKAWNCLPENTFPPPSAPVLSLTRSRGGDGWRNGVCTVCAEARQSWSHPPRRPPQTSSGLQPQVTGVEWSPAGVLGFSSLGVGHCGLHPALRGARTGLLAHCTSLCIPSLFPMQIKLMRIRNIMEPIHRSSRWKMGLTTNFPLQLFCNYRGILWILMETRSCLTASRLLFFFFKERLKKKKRKSNPIA